MKNYPLNHQPNYTNFEQLLGANANSYPQDIAFQYLRHRNGQSISITYRRFYDDVKALSAFFYKKGLCRSKVAVLGENSYEWILTYFAVVMSNNIIIPIDKEFPNDDIAYLLDFSGAELLIYANSYADIADVMLQDRHVQAVLPMKDFSTIIKVSAETEIATDESDLCAII